MSPVTLAELDPQTRAKALQQIGETEGTPDPTQPQVSTSVTVTLTPQETKLMLLHQSATRDTLAIGALLIAMRSEQPRGQWTAYLEGVAIRTGISRSTVFRYIAVIEKPEKAKKSPPPNFHTAKSPHGHGMGTLQSWLQKSIRRGDERQALYAASQFALTGFPGAVFNICFTTASEDIGLADRGLAQEVLALHTIYKIEVARQRPSGYASGDRKNEHHPERLQLTHAVLLCCRAFKSRLVDHATIVAFESPEVKQPPEWVLDKHTLEGAAAGKTAADFFAVENAAMNPKAEIADPYRQEAEQIRTRRQS
jgi:hypothetical protein